mmetsp:Transcript_18018/g.44137  ORF Transcript_18018/g.44137 Transcript_18018/m.44137 type:complete len:96 (+) Transcript_18018:360-647(+)
MAEQVRYRINKWKSIRDIQRGWEPADTESEDEKAWSVKLQQEAAKRAIDKAGIKEYNAENLERILNIDECCIDASGNIFRRNNKIDQIAFKNKMF